MADKELEMEWIHGDMVKPGDVIFPYSDKWSEIPATSAFITGTTTNSWNSETIATVLVKGNLTILYIYSYLRYRRLRIRHAS